MSSATPPASTATAGSGTVYNGPLPDSGAFGIYQAQAQTAYESAMAQIASQRSSLLSSSGFGGSYNPTTGAFTGVSGPLANDPTGSYQQMMSQDASAQQQSDAANSMSGLGFKGGLANQNQDATKLATSTNAANWAQNFQGSLSNLSDQETNQTNSYQSGLTNEMLNEIESGITNQTFNPGDPGTPTSTTPAFTGVGQLPGHTSSVPVPVGYTKGGKAIYGYGKAGNPFFNAGQAKLHGRLGTKKRGA